MSKKHRKKKDRLLIQVRMETPPAYPAYKEAPEEPEPEIGIGSETMTVDAIVSQLASLKDNARSFLHTPQEPDDNIWLADIEACEAATAILSALQDEGIEDPEALKDMIFDYRLLSEQYKKLHQKFNIPSQPKHEGNRELCPTCGRQLSSFWKHCPECGERISRRRTGWRSSRWRRRSTYTRTAACKATTSPRKG